MSLVVRSERMVLPDGVRPATILIRDGRIVSIGAVSDRPAGVPELDAGAAVVLPGVVDTHVHVNDPGRADWEGFAHATRAAAAGGVTTLVDMPLNSIPATTTVTGLEQKRTAARGRCHVDVGFWGGVVPGNAADLTPLARAGVLGFKCFLCPSGVDEFGHVGESDLREALPILAGLELPLLAHAELPELLHDESPSAAEARPDPRRYRTWLDSRPDVSEQAAIEMLVRLATEYGARVHVVHLASAEALPAIRAARAAGVALSVETCPHYLTFAAEEIADGATAFKCAPPIRSRANRDRLWAALVSGDIDLVATDHSPAPPALEAPRRWRLPTRMGRRSVAPARVVDSVDRCRRARCSDGARGGLARRPPGQAGGPAGKRGDCRRTRRRSRRLRPGVRMDGRCEVWTTGTRLRHTTVIVSEARC